MIDVKLHKPEEFDRRFEKHYRASETQEDAYRKTEQDYKSIFGEHKYKNFDSFYQTYIARQRKKSK